MPNVVIEMYPGRTLEQKRAMVQRVTEALVETIQCRPEAVKITFHEVPKENMATGGILHSDQTISCDGMAK